MTSLAFVSLTRNFGERSRGDPAEAGRPPYPERGVPLKRGYTPLRSFLKAPPPLYAFISRSLFSAVFRSGNNSEYIRIKGILYLVDRCFPAL